MKKLNPIVENIIKKRTLKTRKGDHHSVVLLLNDGYAFSCITDDGEKDVDVTPFKYDSISEYTHTTDVTDEFVKSEFTDEELEQDILLITPNQIGHVFDGRLTNVLTFEGVYPYTLVLTTLSVKDVYL